MIADFILLAGGALLGWYLTTLTQAWKEYKS